MSSRARRPGPAAESTRSPAAFSSQPPLLSKRTLSMQNPPDDAYPLGDQHRWCAIERLQPEPALYLRQFPRDRLLAVYHRRDKLSRIRRLLTIDEDEVAVADHRFHA